MSKSPVSNKELLPFNDVMRVAISINAPDMIAIRPAYWLKAFRYDVNVFFIVFSSRS